MKSAFSAMNEVDIFAKLADLRDVDYQHTLLIHALIELLMEKGVLTREELLAKVRHLDTQSLAEAMNHEPFEQSVQIRKAKHAPLR